MIIQGWTDKLGDSISHEPLGMFISPDGNEWSSAPYTPEQKKLKKEYDRFTYSLDKIIKHLTRTDRSILEEIKLIESGLSTLPKHCKELLINKK